MGLLTIDLHEHPVLGSVNGQFLKISISGTTRPMEGHWKYLRDEGSLQTKFYKEEKETTPEPLLKGVEGEGEGGGERKNT